MCIGGKPVTRAEPRPVQLPYDGSTVGTIYQATNEQVDAAITAAVAAAPIMREMTLDEPSTILRKAYQKLLDDRHPIPMPVRSATTHPIKPPTPQPHPSPITPP